MFDSRKALQFLAILSLALLGVSLENLILSPVQSHILLATQPQDATIQKLIGKWQVPANLAYGMIFTSDGKVYISLNPLEIMELRYEIDANFNPDLMTFLDQDREIVGTGIFEFTDNGQLKLEFNLTGEAQRPNLSFSDQAILLNKTSEQPLIPYGMTITNPNASKLKEEADQNSQLEAKQLIQIMNQSHQTIYSEQGIFKATLEEVVKNIPSETRNYFYNIRMIDEKRMVQSVALAKRAGFKSYIGIVYRFQSSPGQDFSTKSIICESNEPTQELPSTPLLLTNTEVKCPVGYSPISE